LKKNIQINKKLISAFLTQGIGALLLIFYDVYSARVLSIHDYGLFSLIFAWVSLLAIFGTLGMNLCILKFLPVYLSQQKWALIKGLRVNSFLWVASFSFLIASIGLVVFILSHENLPPIFFLITAFLIVPVQSLSNIQQAMVRSLGHIQSALTPDYLLKPLVYLLVLFLMYQTSSVSLPTVLLVGFAAAVFSLGVITITQNKLMPQEVFKSKLEHDSKLWFSMAIPFLAITGFNLISGKIGAIMLGLMSTPESVAIYSASSRISDAVIFGLITANTVVAPLISKHYANNEYAKLQQIIQKGALYISYLTIPLGVVIIIFGKNLLNFFGEEYTLGYTPLVILVISQMINGLSGPVAFLLSMTNQHYLTLKIIGTTALLNILLSYFLIPQFEATGASIAAGSSIIIWNVTMIYFCIKKLKIKPYFSIESYLSK
jgi:O-antigen/teichoic acid export membrane protein